MLKKSISLLLFLSVSYLIGCASVPMASMEEDKVKKEFVAPANGNAGLYIYRNSSFGGALKKSVYLNGTHLGESAPYTYFYNEIQAGEHELSTESEFSNNSLSLDVKSGKNYYVRQYIRPGVFVGGANMRIVSEDEGKKGVMECKLATHQPEPGK